jgi:DNA-binding transcriptional regulator YbjK
MSDLNSKPLVVNRQARGDERRLHILRAAWQVIINDGIRGVRHRAVAEVAEVPLASTTYYFKDIQSLIDESMQLFAEETFQRFTEPFWAQAESKFASLKAAKNRQILEQGFIDLGVDYIQGRLADHRDQLVLEYAFWHAAVNNIALRDAVGQLLRRSVALMKPWFEALELTDPEQASRCMLATVRRIEYEGLIAGAMTQRPDWIREALTYQLKALW